MRIWITSLAIGFLIAQAVLAAVPSDTLAAQQTGVRTFGSVEANGSLFVTSSLGLHAIDLAAGTERWRVTTPTAASSYPTFADGIVYFIAEAHLSTNQAAAAYAVDASTGQELWTFAIGGILPTDERRLTGPVIVSDGKAYLFDSTRFFVLDARTGPVNGQPMATGFQPIGATVLAAHGNTLLLANMSHSGVGCVDLSTGEERWTASIPTDSFHVRSASDATTLYLTDTHHSLIALDWATGEQRWSASADTSTEPRFVHVANSEVVLGLGSDLEGFDSADGTLRWQITLSNGSIDDAVVRDGTAFVATDDNTIAVLDVETGAQAWRVPTETRVNTLGFDAGGNVIVMFYADGAQSTPAPDLMLIDATSGSPIWSLTLDS